MQEDFIDNITDVTQEKWPEMEDGSLYLMISTESLTQATGKSLFT